MIIDPSCPYFTERVSLRGNDLVTLDTLLPLLFLLKSLARSSLALFNSGLMDLGSHRFKPPPNKTERGEILGRPRSFGWHPNMSAGLGEGPGKSED
jgi:hypothetical protein